MTLYNLNYGVPVEKTGVTKGEQAIETPETGVSDVKQAFEQQLDSLSFSSSTRKNIDTLYNAFGSKTVFGRAEIMQITGITASPAGELVRKMKNAGLIETVSGQGKGRYKFRA